MSIDNGVCIVKDTINVIFNQPPQLTLGNDISICEGQQLLLNPGIPSSTYTWQDGTHNTSFMVTQQGLYWVEVNQGSCIVRDSILISMYDVPEISLGADQRFCTGDSSLLNAGPGFTSYTWSNGMNSQQITVQTPGTYSVVGTTPEGCESRDTIIILSPYPLPIIELGPSGPLCMGSTRLLNPGSGFNGYTWNTGSTSQSISVNSPGSYTVEVVNANGCKGSDTVTITSISPLPANFLPGDTSICSYGNMILKPITTYPIYQWSTGSTSQSITITQAGMYVLNVKDNSGCSGKDSILVRPKDCMLGFFIPSSFTPNNDGRNDLFYPLLFGNIEKYEFTVFSRWGKIIFKSKTPGQGWNGRVNGIPQDSNVFVWTCNYVLNGQNRLEKGTVLLIR